MSERSSILQSETILGNAYKRRVELYDSTITHEFTRRRVRPKKTGLYGLVFDPSPRCDARDVLLYYNNLNPLDVYTLLELDLDNIRRC
jgi:hypothetical protein